jgi:hypothetical protein
MFASDVPADAVTASVRAVPSGSHDPRPCLGRRLPRASESLSGVVKPIFLIAGRRRRQRPIPGLLPMLAEDMLADAKLGKCELAARD